MIYGTLITENKSCIVLDKILGFEGENNSNKIIFNFKDGFIDGYGILAIKRGEDNGTIELDKVGESYVFTVKSSVLSQVGNIEFQVVITQDDGTVYKYSTFIMTVNDAIDTDIPLPEEYPSWINMANSKLAEIDKAIENSELATEKANETSEQLLLDKENGVFNGEDGISPSAKVESTSSGAIITVTDSVGTTTATIYNGKDGISEETDPIYTADKPNIALKSELPTKVSELENDSKFISNYTETDPVYSSEKSTLALKSELPTKLSQLQNDSEFITKTVNNLTNYYAKTETYTKTEINNLIGGLGSLDLEIVQSLPTVGKENTFYLLAQNREAPDIYDEYLYINGWEKIGNTKVDLTNYYTKSEVDNLIPKVPTKVSELENDSGYLKEYTETDPTVPSHVKGITESDITNWNNKSEFNGSYNDLTDKPNIPSIDGLVTTEQLTQGLSTKQDTLTPGNNITIENGVISATGGSGGITELPIASSTTLGGIKVGEGLNITEDGILSALSGGSGGSLTTLFNGEFTSIATMSAKNLLSDSVYNYDYVIITMYQLVPSNGSKARVTSFIVDPLYTPATTSTGSQQWNANCYDLNPSSGMGYYMTGSFGDGTQLCISAVVKEPGVSDRTHGICKVVGIKLSGGVSSYKETDLISGPVEYGLTNNLTTINQDLVFNDEITNYDEIVFVVDIHNTTNNGYNATSYIPMLTSEIIFSDTNDAVLNGSPTTISTSYTSADNFTVFSMGTHFKNATTLRVRNTVGLKNGPSTYDKFRIRAIKGIKFNGGVSEGYVTQDYVDSAISNAIGTVLGGAY